MRTKRMSQTVNHNPEQGGWPAGARTIRCGVCGWARTHHPDPENSLVTLDRYEQLLHEYSEHLLGCPQPVPAPITEWGGK